jgi:hypothetical protein
MKAEGSLFHIIGQDIPDNASGEQIYESACAA